MGAGSEIERRVTRALRAMPRAATLTGGTWQREEEKESGWGDSPAQIEGARLFAARSCRRSLALDARRRGDVGAL